MFVLSKWQHVSLPKHWCASVRALFYCYYTFLDHTTKISRKVRELRRISASGAPNNVQNCLLDKTNMGKTSQHHIYCPISASSTSSFNGDVSWVHKFNSLFSYSFSLFSYSVSLFSYSSGLFSYPVSLFSHSFSLFSYTVSPFSYPVSLFSYSCQVRGSDSGVIRKDLIMM